METPMPKRNALEIMYDILSLCQTPRFKTHIMYGVNMSYSQLRRYTVLLLRMGLLKRETKGGREFYTTTEEGKAFMVECTHLHKALTRLREEGKEIPAISSYM
jgi:predicted transcriptional regulator